jgi:hypothetical protein
MSLSTYKNFATATVSTGYTNAATSIVLTTGHGALLPAAPFNAVWWDATTYASPDLDPNVEVVRVTAKATDTLTIARAQEGTIASTKNTAAKTYKLLATATADALNAQRIAYQGVGQLAVAMGVTQTSIMPGGAAVTFAASSLAVGDRVVFRALISRTAFNIAATIALPIGFGPTDVLAGAGINALSAGTQTVQYEVQYSVRSATATDAFVLMANGAGGGGYNYALDPMASLAASVSFDVQGKFASATTDALNLLHYSVQLIRATT